MSTAAATIRALAPADLDAVVAIDALTSGRSRREYIERRLRAAQREPALHAQFAAQAGGELAGFMLARVLAGEFGRRTRALRLELFGVRPNQRRSGLGRRLFETLADWCRRHDIEQIRTVAGWRDTQILAWFDRLGFQLATEVILECAVQGGAYHAGRDAPAAADEVDGGGTEIDYGRQEAAGANDHERLARDAADVRSMTPADLDAIVRADRRIIGADRREYIAARLSEAMQESGVRVSLSAHRDGTVVGYLMARADFGDYGRTEPVAVIDTLGVDPDYAKHGVGRALLSQLFANLGALRVERVEIPVPLANLALLGFVQRAGFAPGEPLSFVRHLGQAA